MVKKEVNKIKTLIVFCLGLVALGGFNLAIGINESKVFSIFAGVFGIVVPSICAMQNIKAVERYAIIERIRQADALIENLNPLFDKNISDTFLGVERLDLSRDQVERLNIYRAKKDDNANWIKVTPKTMPQDMQTVIATVEYWNGKRAVMTHVRRNHRKLQWEYIPDDSNIWEPFSADFRITHYMPFPEPVGD